MNENAKSKISATLGLIVIFFVLVQTAFADTLDQETKLQVQFLAGSPIPVVPLPLLIVDDKVELPVQFLPVYPNEESNLEFLLVDEETSSVILLSESESESNLPCTWEWRMYDTRDCDSVPPTTEENESIDDGNTSSDDGNATTVEGTESSNYTIAPNDSVCVQNCRNGSIKSYRKVCVSYSLDPEDSESLNPHIWFRHGCTNCYPSNEKEDETGSLRFDSLHQSVIGTLPTVYSLGSLNAHVRSFGLLNPNAATHTNPATQIEGNILSTVGGFADTKKSVAMLVEVRDSYPQVALRRVFGRATVSTKIVNLTTALNRR